MMQMIPTLRTVLLAVCLAEIAFVAYTGQEAYAY